MTKFNFIFCLLLVGMTLHAMAGANCVAINGHSPHEIKNPLTGQVIATLTCCSGLNQVNNVCKDTSLTDTSLTSCKNHNDCTDKKGCYVMGINDMFVDPLDPEKQDAFQSQMAENGGELKGNNKICHRSAECLSNFCDRETKSGPFPLGGWIYPLNGKCKPRLICRKAALNEPAPGNVECKEGLNRHPISSLCLSNDTYPGLITDFKPIPVAGQQCQFVMNADPLLNQKYMNIAKQTMLDRSAMRFLLATAEVDESKDCMRINTYFKKLGTFMRDQEGIALREYNKLAMKLEADQKVLEEAIANKNSSAPTPDKAVQFDGKSTTYGALLKDIAVGLPALTLQLRSNNARGAYEAAQHAIGREVATKLATVHQEISQMGPFDLNWKVGGANFHVLNPRCRSAFGFISNPFNFAKSMYLFQRWSHLFKINGTGKHNRDIFERDDGMVDTLALIAGFPKEIKKDLVFRDFVSLIPGAPNLPGFMSNAFSTHYLIDPLTNVSPYTFAPIFPFGMAFPRFFMEGGGHGDSYFDLYNVMGMKLNAFNHALGFQPGGLSSSEPEIFKREDRNCFQNPNASNCGEFNVLLKDMRDHMFASFLAYSRTRSASNENLFSGQSWKRRLLGTWQVNFHNLDTYYTGMEEYRTKTEGCLNKVITDIETNLGNTGTVVQTGGTTSGANSTSGVGPGTSGAGTNYYGSGAGAAHLNTGGGKTYTGNSTSYHPSSHNTLAGMTSNLLGALQQGGNMTVLSKALPGTAESGAGGTVVSAESGAASRKRLEDMKAANALAAKNGVDVAAQELSVKDSMDSLNSKYGNGNAGGGNAGMASRNSGSGSGSSGAKNTLDEIKEENKGVATIDMTPGQQGKGAGHGAGGPTLMNYGSMGANANGATTTNANGIDSTGLSAEEQKAILENAERNKAKNDEFTSLFDIISNSYKNNLIRVFGSKKEID